MRLLLWGGISLSLLASVPAQRDGRPARASSKSEAAARSGAIDSVSYPADSLARTLVQHGFENVSAASTGERVIVAYENRVYRYEIRALQEVVKRVMPALEGRRQLTLIPQRRGLPLVAISIPVDAYRSFVQEETSVDQFVSAFNVSLSVEPFWHILRASRPANRSFFKFDLVAHPQFAAQFGNFQDPIESQVNIAPEVTTSLWKGMRLSAQMIIPIQNELEEEGDYLRPGLLTLNQTLRLPSSTFISGSAGYFTRNRYGVDVELKKYVADGRCRPPPRLPRPEERSRGRG